MKWKLLVVNNNIDDDNNNVSTIPFNKSLNACPMPGTEHPAADKTLSALGKFTFQWGRKTINYSVYNMRVLWGEIKHEADREGGVWGMLFLRELREHL